MTLQVDSITNAAGSGKPDFPNGFTGGLPTSQVRADTGNGYGSTNNKVRRFTNFVTVGTAITAADSATLGTTFTINENGVYAFCYCDFTSGAASDFGISYNANSSGTVAYGSLTVTERTTQTNAVSTIGVTSCTTVMRCSAGDVIRAQTDGSTNGATSRVQFLACQISKV